MQDVATFDDFTPDTLSPAYWRRWADRAREAARDVHPVNRQILEDVAISYEEMAQLVESHRPRPAVRQPAYPHPEKARYNEPSSFPPAVRRTSVPLSGGGP
jgi:hypothetical protein